ncbi:MAG: hypothetical protein QM586_15595 [Xenophilus sp.]
MNQASSSAHPTVNGMLFVASDIDPGDEADFNQWYDREHVEERARIPGFLSGARYRALPGSATGTRKYLGLYRTASLEAFTSSAYQAAFERQTAWSVTNLNRMRNPMRRVCAVQAVCGFGSGSQLAILPLPANLDAAALAARAAGIGSQVAQSAGFVQSYLLAPDTALSSPLPRESTEHRVLFPMLAIETGTGAPAIVAQAAELLSASIQQDWPATCLKGSPATEPPFIDVKQAWLYELGWKLHSAELA